MIEQKTLLTFYVFVVYSFVCLAVMQIMSLFTVSAWLGVGVGGGLSVVMLIAYLIIYVKKGRTTRNLRTSWMPYVMLGINAVANGLMISSLFTYLEEFSAIWQTAVLFAVLVVLFFMYCLFTLCKFSQKHNIISLILFLSILLAGAITGIAVTLNYIFALALCMWVVLVAFLIALNKEARNQKAQMTNIAGCSMYTVLLVGIFVIAVVADVDFDTRGDIFPNPDLQQKQNPYAYLTTKNKTAKTKKQKSNN